MFEKIVHGISPSQNDDFKVVNHADLWLNNQLFSYDADNKPNDVLFVSNSVIKNNFLFCFCIQLKIGFILFQVDFQISYWGSPAIDLWYFFMSSTHNDIKHEYDRYVKTYHDYLVDALKTLNYSKKIPTLVDLHKMMLTYGAYGIRNLFFIVFKA